MTTPQPQNRHGGHLGIGQQFHCSIIGARLTTAQARWRKRFPRWQWHMDDWQPCGHTSLYSNRYIESSGFQRESWPAAACTLNGSCPLLLTDAVATIRSEFSPGTGPRSFSSARRATMRSCVHFGQIAIEEAEIPGAYWAVLTHTPHERGAGETNGGAI